MRLTNAHAPDEMYSVILASSILAIVYLLPTSVAQSSSITESLAMGRPVAWVAGLSPPSNGFRVVSTCIHYLSAKLEL